MGITILIAARLQRSSRAGNQPLPTRSQRAAQPIQSVPREPARKRIRTQPSSSQNAWAPCSGQRCANLAKLRSNAATGKCPAFLAISSTRQSDRSQKVCARTKWDTHAPLLMKVSAALTCSASSRARSLTRTFVSTASMSLPDGGANPCLHVGHALVLRRAFRK